MAANNTLPELPSLASTKSQLGALLVKACDLFSLSQISEADLRKYVLSLKANCESIMLEQTGDELVLDRGVLKIIGKKRAMIISAILAPTA